MATIKYRDLVEQKKSIESEFKIFEDTVIGIENELSTVSDMDNENTDERKVSSVFKAMTKAKEILERVQSKLATLEKTFGDAVLQKKQ